MTSWRVAVAGSILGFVGVACGSVDATQQAGATRGEASDAFRRSSVTTGGVKVTVERAVQTGTNITSASAKRHVDMDVTIENVGAGFPISVDASQYRLGTAGHLLLASDRDTCDWHVSLSLGGSYTCTIGFVLDWSQTVSELMFTPSSASGAPITLALTLDACTECGTNCVDVATDEHHCGACWADITFSRGSLRAVCTAGRPVCPSPAGADHLDYCRSTGCTSLQADFENCGACGVRIPDGASCVAGAIVCDTGKTRCGDKCVDLKSDAKNCGVCGVAVPPGAACALGVARCSNFRETICGGACVDRDSDEANCGACGHACTPSTTCGSVGASDATTTPLGGVCGKTIQENGVASGVSCDGICRAHGLRCTEERPSKYSYSGHGFACDSYGTQRCSAITPDTSSWCSGAPTHLVLQCQCRE